MTEFALNALVDMRARLMGEIKTRQLQLSALKLDLVHLDSVIQMFKPGYDVASIKPKLTYGTGIPTVVKGTGTRGALDVLREAGTPLTTREIARALLLKHGLTADAKAVNRLSATIHSSFSRRKDGAVRFDATTHPGTWGLSDALTKLAAS